MQLSNTYSMSDGKSKVVGSYTGIQILESESVKWRNVAGIQKFRMKVIGYILQKQLLFHFSYQSVNTFVQSFAFKDGDLWPNILLWLIYAD